MAGGHRCHRVPACRRLFHRAAVHPYQSVLHCSSHGGISRTDYREAARMYCVPDRERSGKLTRHTSTHGGIDLQVQVVSTNLDQVRHRRLSGLPGRDRIHGPRVRGHGHGAVGAKPGPAATHQQAGRPAGSGELDYRIRSTGHIVSSDADGPARKEGQRHQFTCSMPGLSCALPGASSSTGFRPPCRLSTHVASRGAKIAVTRTADATCAVATST